MFGATHRLTWHSLLNAVMSRVGGDIVKVRILQTTKFLLFWTPVYWIIVHNYQNCREQSASKLRSTRMVWNPKHLSVIHHKPFVYAHSRKKEAKLSDCHCVHCGQMLRSLLIIVAITLFFVDRELTAKTNLFYFAVDLTVQGRLYLGPSLWRADQTPRESS